MPSPLRPHTATLPQPAIQIWTGNEPGTLVHCRGLAPGNVTYLAGDEINTANETTDEIANIGVEEREELGAVCDGNPQALFGPISDASSLNDRREIREGELGHVTKQNVIRALQSTGYHMAVIQTAIDKILSDLPNTKLTPEAVEQVLEQGPRSQDESENIVKVGDMPANKADLKKLQLENRTLREAYICKLCLEENISIAFLPCGHLTCCTKCFENMKNICNACHQPVTVCIPVNLEV